MTLSKMQCITLPRWVYFLNVFELTFIASLFPSTFEREHLIKQPHFIAANHKIVSYYIHKLTVLFFHGTTTSILSQKSFRDKDRVKCDKFYMTVSNEVNTVLFAITVLAESIGIICYRFIY